jgi:Flp pilus assembly protein TadG
MLTPLHMHMAKSEPTTLRATSAPDSIVNIASDAAALGETALMRASRRNLKTRRKRESGQVVVLVVLMIAVLCGLTGLAVDEGMFQTDRRKMQAAADSAAIAGDEEILSGNSDSISTAAMTDAGKNGFTNGSDNVTVTVNNPPQSGSYSGDNNAVEVTVSAQRPTYFLNALGMSTINVSTRAVAHLGNAPYCIDTLNPTAANSLSLFGVALLQTCGIVNNSTSDHAFGIFGVALWHASSIGIVGNYDFDLLPFVSPRPVTGIAPVRDPLARLQPPSFGGCDHTNFSLGLISIATMNPGVYCGGITLTGAAILHLNPGTYVIRGGGLNILGASVIAGSGVTFYITGDSTYPYKGVNIAAASVHSLTAPTSGAMEGILFFQDRDISAATAAANPNNIVGAALARYEGTFYFPTTTLNYTINASVAAYTAMVADQIKINLVAAGYVNNDYSSLADGSPLKAVTLGE